ncbi:MAG: penicillin-binding protein 2 [bacterium]
MIYSNTTREDIKLARRKIIIVGTIFAFFFSVVVLRLYQVQILQGGGFKKESEENRIQFIPVTAPRGRILDRKGTVLVRNRPSFDISVIQLGLSPQILERTITGLSRILNLSPTEIRERLSKEAHCPFNPALIIQDVDRKTMTQVAERKIDLPGVIIQVSPRRDYVYGDLAAHIIGYLGEVSGAELEELRQKGYRSGDLIGKAGVEREFDDYLRGENGVEQVEVDVKGRRLGTISRKDPTLGDNLTLTIDYALQRTAEEALGDSRGAVVVLDVNTGGILAMASKPAFDPNVFVSPQKKIKIKDFFSDPRYPLLNRAISAQYSPGSQFKIVVASAALENNLVKPSETFYCGGSYYLGRRYACWKEQGHGWKNLEEAIIHSCNVYFYQLGLKVGAERMAEMARNFGLGQFSQISFPHEKPGLVPDPAWKKKTLGERWHLGETVNFSIGQGYLLTTPIQLANLMAAVVNGGRIYKPLVVKAIHSPDGKVINSFEPQLLRKFSLKRTTLSLLHNALEGVVSRGTGWQAKIKDLRIGGKTGTAQNPHGEDHAWFMCFAPVDKPELAVSVLVEHGGHGGAAAAPIARKIMETYFTENSTSNLKVATTQPSSP